jgi:4'-phosphopantetheinyl transferase
LLEIELGELGELCREARARGRAALSRAEWLRFEGIGAPQRRDQFLAAHWLARRCLARLRPALQITEIASDAEGAPWLPEHPDLFLSLAHSGSSVGCAVSSAPVGVDLERLGRVLDTAAAGRIVCAPAERRLLAAGADDERGTRFLQLWSLKEAWFKSRRRAMWLHAMAAARVRRARAAQPANALSGIDPARGVVLSVVAAPALIAGCGARWPLATQTRWQVLEGQSE